jgi:hypothetical protein
MCLCASILFMLLVLITSVSAYNSTGHSNKALQSAFVDTFTDTKNSIVCAGKMLKQSKTHTLVQYVITKD